MFKPFTLLEWTTIKSEKCENRECSIYQMFSPKVRARHHKLVLMSDKCSFNCQGYHTDHDKRRKMYLFIPENAQAKLVFDYKSSYIVDYSLIKENQQPPNKQNQNLSSQNKDIFAKTCRNLVEYQYHPENFKTVVCPYGKSNRMKGKKEEEVECPYKYCPFIHPGEVINGQLSKILQQYRNNHSVNNRSIVESKFQQNKKIFHDKISAIMLLRSSSSIEELQQKQLQKEKLNVDGLKILNRNLYLSDKSELLRMKQKLIMKANQCLKIDKLLEQEQQSRKVINNTYSKQKSNPNKAQYKPSKQTEIDVLGVSYNYFRYGEKLPMIEGRTIQFKHFKDISDPNHIPLIMRYIAAFLNAEGGKLYIGIDDNSYVYGAKLKQSEYDKLLLKIDNEAKMYMNPPLMPQKYSIKLIPVYHDKKGQERQVIQIMVYPPKEQSKKLFLYNRECYMRMNASTQKLNASDIIELISLNSQNQLQAKQEQPLLPTSQLEQKKNQQDHNKNQIKTQSQLTQTNHRQNKLMTEQHHTVIERSNSIQFLTEQQKQKEFRIKLQKKSIEDLYSLRKDYQSKLNLIISICNKKQRELR